MRNVSPSPPWRVCRTGTRWAFASASARALCLGDGVDGDERGRLGEDIAGRNRRGGGRCGFQFRPCVGQHTSSKHLSEQVTYVLLPSAIFHQRRLVPRTHGMPCTISVQSARPRSSHVSPSGWFLRGRTTRGSGARYLLSGLTECHRQARN